MSNDEPKQLGKCIRCDKPVFGCGAPIDGNPDGAMEGVMRGHYGSRNDLSEFTAWICDDCVPNVTVAMTMYLGPEKDIGRETRPTTRAEYDAWVNEHWDENGNVRPRKERA